MNSSRQLLITTLAIYQTRFWVEVAKLLRKQGHSVTFISFDDRSCEYLTENSFKFFAASQEDKQQANRLMLDVNTSIAAYGIENLDFWLTHERFAFDLRDSQAMTLRLLTYLVLADRAIAELSADTQPVMVQELGGFISVIASFMSARKHGIDNWFIEPSFFRGRQFFLKNSFTAAKIPKVTVETACDAVKDYLKEVQANKTIVVPIKDKHHYSKALSKILNIHNIRRLIEKSIDKYILGKHQEFGHLGSHVRRHVSMLLNSLKLKGRYTELSKLKNFVYYPLHVPGDMALTLRSPQFLDQLGLIDYLVRNLPTGYKLAIKEHPAMMGAVDARRLKSLLDRYDQLALIDPAENNFDVLGRSKAVISVNSKSGAEAILLGKPVLVLGDAFYRDSPLVKPVENLKDVSVLLQESLKNNHNTKPEELESYFEQVWRCTLPGELYVEDESNIATFTASLLKALDIEQADSR